MSSIEKSTLPGTLRLLNLQGLGDLEGFNQNQPTTTKKTPQNLRRLFKIYFKRITPS